MAASGARLPLSQRYSRAARLTGPKVVAATPGLSFEGYWIDSDRYFFLGEQFNRSIGTVLPVPSLVDCRLASTETLISPQALADLLTRHSTAAPVELEALCGAQFDMTDGDTLAVTLGARDYLIDWRQRRIRQSSASLEVAALYSPDGQYACFVRDHDLWLRNRQTGTESPLTRDGAPHHFYGQRAETALQAVSYRRHPVPVGLWSSDSRWLLTHRIDERSVPDLTLVENVPQDGGRPVAHRFRYAMPGDPLPTATIVAIDVVSGRTLSFDDFQVPLVLPFSSFSQMAWFGGKDAAWVVRFDRYFKQVDLIRLDFTTASGRVVLSEQSASGYLDLHPLMGSTLNVRTLDSSDEVIWFSERDGWGHLYLYDASSGRLKNQITQGEWLVRDIVHVDERARKVLFLAAGIEPKADPARRSLCAVGFDGHGFEVLLRHEGDISCPRAESYAAQDRPFRPFSPHAAISPDGHRGIVRYASLDRGNRTEIVDFVSRRELVLSVTPPMSGEGQVRRFTALAADGLTSLHGVLFLPSHFDETRRYPLIDYVYPGPQTAWQPQSDTSLNAMQARVLAELGFVTVMLDTRGIPNGSRAAHQVGYGELLEPQLADHAAVVRQLSERYSFIDVDRVGIIGASGGGSATARALFDHGDVFKVGVSVCGNHDSTLYASVWSDKYRGPGDRKSWTSQATGATAARLRGKLLLISGDMDENVHVSHTLSLANALIRANRDFDLLIVPNEGHSVLLTSGYAQRRVWDYFVRHLLRESPPEDFNLTFSPMELARMWSVVRREFLP